MRPHQHRLFPVALVLLLSMVTAVYGYHRGPKNAGADVSSLSVRQPVLQGPASQDHLLSSLADHPLSGQRERKERRHGKSLLNEAIVADGSPVVEPEFIYCHRIYSLYLPGGCSQETTGNFSLRGPPSLS